MKSFNVNLRRRRIGAKERKRRKLRKMPRRIINLDENGFHPLEFPDSSSRESAGKSEKNSINSFILFDFAAIFLVSSLANKSYIDVNISFRQHILAVEALRHMKMRAEENRERKIVPEGESERGKLSERKARAQQIYPSTNVIKSFLNFTQHFQFT